MISAHFAGSAAHSDFDPLAAWGPANRYEPIVEDELQRRVGNRTATIRP